MFERIQVVDADTHITEPPDSWGARVSSKRGDAIPRIERIDGYDVWVLVDNAAGLYGVTFTG